MIDRRSLKAGATATASLVVATVLALAVTIGVLRLSTAGSSVDLAEGLALGVLAMAVPLVLSPVLALGSGWVAARSTGEATWRRSWRLGLGAWIGLFVPLVVSMIAGGSGPSPLGMVVVLLLLAAAGTACSALADMWAAGTSPVHGGVRHGRLASATLALLALLAPVVAFTGFQLIESAEREAEEEAGTTELLGELEFPVLVPSRLPEGLALDEAFAAIHPPMGGPARVRLSYRSKAPGGGSLELDQTKLGFEPTVTEPGVCAVSFFERDPLTIPCIEVATASGIRLLGLIDEDPTDLSVVAMEGTLILLRSWLLTPDQLLEIVDSFEVVDPATIEGIAAI